MPRITQMRTLSLLASLVLLGMSARADEPTLYERLGGEAVLTRVATNTIERAAHDPRTERSFKDFKLVTIEKSLAQQLCAVSGGPCHYEGDTMATAHKDLHIKPSEFEALVAILREELDAAGVNAGAKNDLLKVLAPMKRDIVAPAS